MKERDRSIFIDISSLVKTEGIEARANTEYIQNALDKVFPDEHITVSSVKVNSTGMYKRLLGNIKGLPEYVDLRITHISGGISEHITVWSPLRWNERFIGTGGGGTGTGGEFYITRPDNTSRAMTLPKAVINGCTAATTDAGNMKNDWAFDKDGTFNRECYENWRARSTHFMTLCGKAVAEALHGKAVKYSYFHGGSGGGRQALVEAQDYPLDYNGIWASCPAINWNRFVLGGLWAIAVMNEQGYILSAAKLSHLTKCAQQAAGGTESYYQKLDRTDYNALSAVGDTVNGKQISEKDANIMNAIWRGPHSEAGEQLWYAYRPGVVFWNKIIPIGAFYYNLFGKPKLFQVSKQYARWVTGNPKQDFSDISALEFEELFEKSRTDFSEAGADKPDLSEFYESGAKLIIDHGTDDPLIPVDGTLDYYRRVCEVLGKEKTDSFIRLFITPGDGHGNCRWHGAGITESDGMKALIDWVEGGKAPDEIRTVLVKKEKTVCEKLQTAINLGGSYVKN